MSSPLPYVLVRDKIRARLSVCLRRSLFDTPKPHRGQGHENDHFLISSLTLFGHSLIIVRLEETGGYDYT
jgi:hypothetical protein